MNLENTIQKAAEAVLQDHLAPKLAREIAHVVAEKCGPAVLTDILATLGATRSRPHTKPATNGHTTSHPKKTAEPKTDDVIVPREPSGPSTEVMRLKKSLFHAKRRSDARKEEKEKGTPPNPKNAPQGNDTLLIANAAVIDALTTADFAEKNLTAAGFIKRLRRKAGMKASGKVKTEKKVKKKAEAKNGHANPESAKKGLDAVL